MTDFRELEAESIHIFREVAAEAENPVFLYSVGKDSAVMLHLAMKAFFPAKPPFSFLHVDTTWKFREMIEFRDRRAKELGLDLIVHTNLAGLEAGVGPFTHGSARHTEVMKTEALKQALDKHSFDVALGAHGVTKKNREPEQNLLSAHANITGTQKISVPNFGLSIIQASNPVRVSVCFHCPTGLNSISGNISFGRTFRFLLFIWPRNVWWSSATAY